MRPIFFQFVAANIFLALAFAFSPSAHAGEKVMFYMHGSDMHGKSPDSKKGENWKKVVSGLRDRTNGMEIVFDFRTSWDLESHTAQTVQMVKDRIASGTPPEDIYVGGFSYGAMVALQVASEIGNDKINLVLFCGCRRPDVETSAEINYAAVKGRVFSIIDTDDKKFASCKGRLPLVTDLTEKSITSGKGHSVFKRTKYFDMWLTPFVGWI